MTEIPRGTQFVGQADARRSQPEAPKQDEFTPSPEQQQAGDVMQESGNALESKMLDAHEQAGKQLQQLHGKDLVNAGFRQMGKGVWETAKSAVIGFVGGAVVGGIAGRNAQGEFTTILGLQSGLPLDTGPFSRLSAGSQTYGLMGGMGGATLGMEASHFGTRKMTRKDASMNPVRWYDWVASRTLGMLAGTKFLASTFRDYHNVMNNGADMTTMINPKRMNTMSGVMFGAQILMNPMTFAGLRSVFKGWSEMRKGM